MNKTVWCQYDWNSRNPGYVYWGIPYKEEESVCIEHLGPMRDDWIDRTSEHGFPLYGLWREWNYHAIEKCKHLEELGIHVSTGTFSLFHQWFGWAEKREDIDYVEYLEMNGQFFIKDDNLICFIDEEPRDVPDAREWIVDVLLWTWNKDTEEWTTSEHSFDSHGPHNCAYNLLVDELGWKFGTSFWKPGKTTNEPPFNIIGMGYNAMVKAYKHYNLPQENPVYRRWKAEYSK